MCLGRCLLICGGPTHSMHRKYLLLCSTQRRLFPTLTSPERLGIHHVLSYVTCVAGRARNPCSTCSVLAQARRELGTLDRRNPKPAHDCSLHSPPTCPWITEPGPETNRGMPLPSAGKARRYPPLHWSVPKSRSISERDRACSQRTGGGLLNSTVRATHSARLLAMFHG